METEEILKRCITVLKEGGTLLYPTDTIWGIGCDAGNASAVEKIYAIKQRDRSKSMLVLMSSCEIVPERRESRPTTYIVEARRVGAALAENLVAADGTIGIRVPRHEFCQRLLRAWGKPIVSTSANFSGEASPKSHSDISEKLKESIDYCVPALPEYESHETQSSRIIKRMSDGTEIVIR